MLRPDQVGMDFSDHLNGPKALIPFTWRRVHNGIITSNMIKRLQAVGNSSGVIIDRPILDLLNITSDTQLEVSTDGERLIITPLRGKGSARKAKIAKEQAEILAKHADTFRKLSK